MKSNCTSTNVRLSWLRASARWALAARQLYNKPLTNVVKQFSKHAPLLLNYLRHRPPEEETTATPRTVRGPTNAFAEYLNSEIQQIRVRARGFRRFAGYRLAILFFLGKLACCPQTFP